VGTLDAYFEAHQDLLLPDSPFHWRDRGWPLRTYKPNLPPPLIMSSHDDDSSCTRNCIICASTVIQDSKVSKSIIGHDCLIGPNATLEECILLGRTQIGRGAKLRRTIVDKDARIPAGAEIGYSADADRAKWFVVTSGGVTVVPRNYRGE
jgi:glucose-1-phosphate adenylyltransferase